MDRSQMHCAKLKKPDSKTTYSDSIYVTFWQRQAIGTENRLVIHWGKEFESLDYKGLAQVGVWRQHRVWVMEPFCILTVVVLYNSAFVKTHRTVHQKGWISLHIY